MKKFLPWLIVMFAACSKTTSTNQLNTTPQANFSFTGDSASPEVVVFTNLSTTVTPYRWSFGDGTFLQANGTAPISHAFPDAGTYTVTLTSYSATDSASFSKTVTLLPVKTRLLGVSFTSTPDSATQNYFIDTLPVQAVLNLRASGPVTYKVDFGDGTTDTTLQHTYKTGPGIYHVIVKAISKYGEDTASGNVEIFELGEKKYGGVIFHINNDGHGYVAAENVFSTSFDWGCNNFPIGVTDSIMGSGFANTQHIIDTCGTTTIAYYCTLLTINGFADWYLPSVVELRTLAPLVGRSTADGYVSSTENDATTYMTDLPVGTGTPATAPKTSPGSLNVIPVRKF